VSAGARRPAPVHLCQELVRDAVPARGAGVLPLLVLVQLLFVLLLWRRVFLRGSRPRRDGSPAAAAPRPRMMRLPRGLRQVAGPLLTVTAVVATILVLSAERPANPADQDNPAESEVIEISPQEAKRLVVR